MTQARRLLDYVHLWHQVKANADLRAVVGCGRGLSDEELAHELQRRLEHDGRHRWRGVYCIPDEEKLPDGPA